MAELSDAELAAYHQKKRADRKQRQQSEKQAKRDLDALSTDAIDQALRAATNIVAGQREIGLEIELDSNDTAVFVRKRINEALRADEWLHEVRIWIWRDAEHRQQPLSAAGAKQGIELRIEAV